MFPEDVLCGRARDGAPAPSAPCHKGNGHSQNRLLFTLRAGRRSWGSAPFFALRNTEGDRRTRDLPKSTKADAGLAKDREKGYPEKELRLPLAGGSRSWHGAVCAPCTVTYYILHVSAPYQCSLIRGQPFFRAGCRPATAGRRVPAARRLAIVSCGTPFDVCTVPSAKFSGVTVRKSSTTRGHFPQCLTWDLPKATKRTIQKKNSGSRWQAEAGAGTARFAPFARLPNQHNVFGPVSVLSDTGPALF